MAEPVIKFNNSTVTGRKAVNASYQTKRYPEGVILYTTSAELPDSLSANALIFTTDTAELYVGTGTGIKKLKLGSEADLDPAIYLKISSARASYQTKLAAEESANTIKASIAELKQSIYSKEDIDRFITEDINLDGVIDKMNLYTVDRINELLEERASTVDVYTRDQANEIYETKASVDSVTELSGKHDQLEQTVTDLTAVVNTKAIAADVYTKVEVDETINSIDQNINTLNDNVTELQTKSAIKAEVEASIASINNDITDLRSVKANQEAVDAKDQELEKDIIDISRDLEDLTADVYHKSDVDSKVQEVSEAISACDGKINTTASNIRSEIADINNIVTENKAIINGNVQDIADNKLAINMANSNISDLQTAVSTKAEASNVYTKDEISELLSGKANLEEVYKRIDTYSAEKIQELFAQEDESDLSLFYTKTESDNLFANKVAYESTVSTVDQINSSLSEMIDVIVPGISEKADAAVETSNEALIAANDSKVVASNANNVSIEAKATAESAKTMATDAKNAAINVTSIAETANTKADTAVETARAAEDAVGEATRAADLLTTRVANVELNFAALRNNVVSSTTFATELNKKADLSLLDFKASKVEVEQGLLLKANQSDFEALQEAAATKEEVTDALALKANQSTVDGQISDINTEIEDIKASISDIRDKMADTTDVDVKLEKKADANKVYTKEEVDELINDAVTQVLNALTFKLLGQV